MWLPPTPEPVNSDMAQWGRAVRPEAALGQGPGSSWLELLPSCSPAPAPQELLLAPALLEQLTCTPGSGELGRILTVPQGQQPVLQGYRGTVCSGQAAARARRFSGLAAELRNQLDVARIAQQVSPACRLAAAAGPTGPMPRSEGALRLLQGSWACGHARGACLWLASCTLR